jgi:hypothetical protein
MGCLNKSLSVLIILMLVCLLGITSSFQTAKGFSKTFQLVPEAYQGISQIELQVGDRLVGSFTITNLGPYEDPLFGKSVAYYLINVYLENPDGQTILNYTNYPNGGATFSYSFNFTALDWGVYNIWVYCGGNLGFIKPQTPEMTLDYNILKAVLPEPAIPDLIAWWKLD